MEGSPGKWLSDCVANVDSKPLLQWESVGVALLHSLVVELVALATSRGQTRRKPGIRVVFKVRINRV